MEEGEGNVRRGRGSGDLTWRRRRSSPQTAALFQSMTSEKGSTQLLLRKTGMHAACRASRNLGRERENAV